MLLREKEKKTEFEPIRAECLRPDTSDIIVLKKNPAFQNLVVGEGCSTVCVCVCVLVSSGGGVSNSVCAAASDAGTQDQSSPHFFSSPGKSTIGMRLNIIFICELTKNRPNVSPLRTDLWLVSLLFHRGKSPIRYCCRPH